MDLKMPIREAGGIYKRYAFGLEKLGIITFEDFLYHIPTRYEDYSLISKIEHVQPGEKVSIQGRIIEIKNEYTRGFKVLQKAKVADESGEIEIIWFNQPFIPKTIHKEDFVSLAGKIGEFLNRPVMESPEYEVLRNSADQKGQERQPIHTGRLVPIYPETRGISSKWLRRQIFKILQNRKQNMIEYLPDSIIVKNALIPIYKSIEQIHFPDSYDNAQKARERLAFDELFLLQLTALRKRSQWQNSLKSSPFLVSKFKKHIQDFWGKLPFELTNAQKKAVSEIFHDLSQAKPMNRLLQGDVGSGKTVVAAIAMYLAHLNGFQSVLMSPTEILAEQHFDTISKLLSSLGVKVDLATSSQKSIKYHVASSKNKKGKSKHTTNYVLHTTDILIGTHAVLNLDFKNLGLVVIDEQHRFGVEQRAILRQKGTNPHLLTMTATPIPRTVALTLYGDLDLSYLDEMPKGRKLIKTWIVPPDKRERAYEWIEKQIRETKSQAFVICPFIEQSESMQTVKAATKEYERLKKEVFPNLKLGLLHGKMKSKDKNEILKEFREKKIDILVATPVVEVGIDIPNATIIIIEAAERFGLAGLHQLRGRVGRGEKQSYCLLFTDSQSQTTRKRLQAMEQTNIGAQLAELDLKLRGPGEIYGTLQHGSKELKIASFSDVVLIEKAKKEAQNIFPNLSSYPHLKEKIKELSAKQVSPD